MANTSIPYVAVMPAKATSENESQESSSKEMSRSFIDILVEMLEKEDPRIISWNAAGTEVQIHDKGRLEKEVLPKFFKHSRYHSFTRQLNYHGFLIVRFGLKGSAIYACDLFSRDNLEKAKLIKRRVTRRRDCPTRNQTRAAETPEDVRKGGRKLFDLEADVSDDTTSEDVESPKQFESVVPVSKRLKANTLSPIENKNCMSGTRKITAPRRRPELKEKGIREGGKFVSYEEAMTAMILGSLAKSAEVKVETRPCGQHPFFSVNGFIPVGHCS